MAVSPVVSVALLVTRMTSVVDHFTAASNSDQPAVVNDENDAADANHATRRAGATNAVTPPVPPSELPVGYPKIKVRPEFPTTLATFCAAARGLPQVYVADAL